MDRERIAWGRPVARPLLFALLVLAAGGGASAQDLAPSPEQVSERTRDAAAIWRTFRDQVAGIGIRADQSLISSGEFDGARTWWFRSGLALEGGVPITESFALGISPAIAWERLAVEGSDDFIIAETGRDAQLTDFLDNSFRLGARYDFNEAWAVEGVAGYSARFETGADYGRAIQPGGSVAIGYRRGRWLRLRLGVGVGADLDDGRVRFSPTYRIRIRPAPRWTLEASGLQGGIEWRAPTGTSLSLEAGADGSQYKLDPRRDPPDGPGDGTLQRRQTRIGLQLRHRFHENLRLLAALGVVLQEKLSIFDEDGTELEERRERDPSATFRLGVEYRL